jgi:hypothetical protein
MIHWTGIMFFICLFFMPETLFDRSATAESDSEVVVPDLDDDEKIQPSQEIHGERYVAPPMTFKTYMNRLWFIDLERPPTRKLRAIDFVVKPLSMLKYPSVAIPAFY